jgi:hypothetical protein
MGFTQEELAAMAAADAEIEAEFYLTDAERREGTLMDREAKQQEWGQKRRKNAERCKAYYEANREAVRAKQAEHRKEHREEINEKRRAAYAANIEDRRAEARDRHAANPEKRRAMARAYYRRNREAVLARNKRYRERAKERMKRDG